MVAAATDEVATVCQRDGLYREMNRTGRAPHPLGRHQCTVATGAQRRRKPSSLQVSNAASVEVLVCHYAAFDRGRVTTHAHFIFLANIETRRRKSASLRPDLETNF